MADLQFVVSALDKSTAALLKVAAQLDKVGDKLDKLDGKVARIAVALEGDKKAIAGIDNVERKMRDLDGKKASIKVDVDKSLGDGIVKLALLGKSLKFLALPAAAIAAAPQLASIGAAAVAASGALLLLPAAGLAAAAAGTALAVGFAHVNDALGPTGTPAQLKKVNEALAALSPNARKAVDTIRGFGPAWSSLRLDVQDKLFAGLSERIKALGGVALPVLKTGLSGIAVELNTSAKGFLDWAKSSNTVRSVSMIFDQTRLAVKALAPAVTNVAAGILDIGVTGSKYLPSLAAHAANLTQRFRDWAAAAKESGKLDQWIQTGIEKVKQLGEIVGNVGGILASVFHAADASGADFLGTIERITGGINDFLKSAQGQNAIVSLFGEIRATVDALTPGIKAVGAAAAYLITQLAQAGVLHSAGEGLSAILVAAMPLVKVLTDLAVVVLPPILHLLTDLAPVLTPIVIGFLAVSTAAKGLSIAQAAITGFGTKIAEAALSAGVFTEKVTGSAAAGQKLASAGGALQTGLAGLSTVLAGVALYGAGVALTYSEMRDKSDELTASVMNGQRTMGAAIAEQADRLQNQAIIMSQVSGEAEAMGQGIGELTGQLDANSGAADATAQATAQLSAKHEEMISRLPVLEQLQVRVTDAENAFKDAVIRFGEGSSQAIAAHDALVVAKGNLARASDDAARAEKSLGDQIVDTMNAAAAAANADVGYQQSLLTLQDAQDRAAEAARHHAAGSREVTKANLEVQAASLQAAAAAQRKAEADATAAGASNVAQVGAQAYKEELLRQAATMDGPSKAALIALANGTQTAAQAHSTAEIKARLQKDELQRLADKETGPVKAALEGAKRDLDNAGGAHASAEQKASAQRAMLERLAAQTTGPTHDAIMGMINDLGAIPKNTTFTVTGVGQVSYGSPELLRAAHGGYTGGIIGMGRAGLTGVAYADGGVTPGYTPGRDVHRFTSATGGTLDLSGGEAVMRPEWTRAVGPSYVRGANAAARSGGARGVRRFMGYAAGGIIPDQAFADGGMVLTGTAFRQIPPQLFNTVAGSLVGTIRSAIDSAINTLIAQVKAAAAAAAAAARAVAGIGGAIGGAIGGGGARAWIIAHESGGNPRAQNPTSSASGLYQFIDGTWRSLGGSTAHAKDASVAEQNAIADRYVAQRYGSWEGAVRFWQAHGWYDKGGYLQPGMTMAMNNTGSAERVLSPAETQAYNHGGDDALLAELRRLNGTTRMLRGDVDHHSDYAELISAVRSLSAQLAGAGRSATGESSGQRFVSVLGAF